MRNGIIIGLGVIAILVIGRFYPLTREPRGQAMGEPIVEIRVPAISATALRGEQLFNANCASCHGTNAVGQQGVAPPLVHIIYEPGHHGDLSFLRAVRNGVRAHHWPFGHMPPVENLSDEDVASIVLYVRELQQANGIF